MRTITMLCLLLAVLAGCNRNDVPQDVDDVLLEDGETREYTAPEEVGGYGETLSLDGTFDSTYAGARLSLSYYPDDNEFRGVTFFDGYFGPARNVAFEISLSNGVVLRPKPIKKLSYGDIVPVVFKASDEPFDTWSAIIKVDE